METNQDNSLTNLGERMRNVRIGFGLSQEELGARIDVRREQLSKYEAGKTEPGATVLVKLAALGADPRYLLNGATESNAQAVDIAQQTLIESIELVELQLAGAVADAKQRATLYKLVYDQKLRGVNAENITHDLKNVVGLLPAAINSSVDLSVDEVALIKLYRVASPTRRIILRKFAFDQALEATEAGGAAEK